jgi:hypothetical protein
LSLNTSQQILLDNKFRFWVSLSVFVIASLLLSQKPPINLLWTTVLFIGYCGLFGLAQIEARQGRAGSFLQYSLLTIDVLAVTTAIHLTGDFKSPLYVLYIVIFGVCLYHQSLSNFVYGVVLSVLLYGGLPFWEGKADQMFLSEITGQLLLMLVLTGVLYSVLRLMLKERWVHERLVSHVLTMGNIADLLSGAVSTPRETVKTVSRLIEEEMGPEGLKCRITLHKPDQGFFPPSGGRVGVHLPIAAGESIFGTMVVTSDRNSPLTSYEQNFFSSVSRSLGLYLHRSQIWENFERHKAQESTVLERSSLV